MMNSQMILPRPSSPHNEKGDVYQYNDSLCRSFYRTLYAYCVFQSRVCRYVSEAARIVLRSYVRLIKINCFSPMTREKEIKKMCNVLKSFGYPEMSSVLHQLRSYDKPTYCQIRDICENYRTLITDDTPVNAIYLYENSTIHELFLHPHVFFNDHGYLSKKVYHPDDRLDQYVFYDTDNILCPVKDSLTNPIILRYASDDILMNRYFIDDSFIELSQLLNK